MTYTPAPKTRLFAPYDPSTGTYRVRMDANESFLLPTDEDRQRMAQAAAEVALNRYPDPMAGALCGAFASLYGVAPALVTAGNGSDELISLILSAFLQKGETVLTLTPDFSMYSFYTAITETPCVSMNKEPDGRIDVDRVLATAKMVGARMIIFSNPCNPTSLGLSADETRRLIRGTDALVVLDEAYMDFWDQSLLDEAEGYDNLIILRTGSKALGLAALRVGFAVANRRLTGILRAAKSPYNVNAVTQAMATVALSNPLYHEVYRGLLLPSRDMLVTGLRKLEAEGLLEKVFDSVTNFAYVKVKDTREIYDDLADRGILIRRFGEEFLRITAGTESENQELLATLECILRRR